MLLRSLGSWPGYPPLLIVVDSGCADCSPRMQPGEYKTDKDSLEKDTGGERHLSHPRCFPPVLHLLDRNIHRFAHLSYVPEYQLSPLLDRKASSRRPCSQV